MNSLPNIPEIKTFHLSPLTTAQADELITALDPMLAADERAEVQHRCDGIPLYIEEIVTKLHEQPANGARSTYALRMSLPGPAVRASSGQRHDHSGCRGRGDDRARIRPGHVT